MHTIVSNANEMNTAKIKKNHLFCSYVRLMHIFTYTHTNMAIENIFKNCIAKERIKRKLG